MPTSTADLPAQGPSLAEAAVAFEGLLDLPEDPQDQQTTAEERAPADTDEGVAEAETTSEETAAQADADEAEATEAEGETEAANDKARTVTVTIDGKTQQITLQEAVEGYQRQGDYTRKTTELARERRAFEQQALAVGEERQQYATMLVALREQLQTQEPEPDWDAVYQVDPVGYARRRDEWRDRQEKVAAANFELQRLHTVQQQKNAENLQQVVAKGREKMLDLNPAWKDQKVWEADRQRIVDYARDKVGYSNEEIAQAYDPRAIVVMHKARLYDELMAAGKPKPDAVRGPRVASAGAAPAGNNASKLNAAQQRLAKSGRIADAAKVFEQLL